MAGTFRSIYPCHILKNAVNLLLVFSVCIEMFVTGVATFSNDRIKIENM